MKIEHIAFNVPDPGGMAQWYVANLGMKIVFSGPPPVSGRFLADSSGKVMVELYNNPKAAPPDYFAIDPITLHLAFVSDDVPTDARRLCAAGASMVGEINNADNGDVLAMLRDPWGLSVQLAKRAKPMI